MSRDLRLQKFKTISPFICKFSENGLLMHICMYALHTIHSTQYVLEVLLQSRTFIIPPAPTLGSRKKKPGSGSTTLPTRPTVFDLGFKKFDLVL